MKNLIIFLSLFLFVSSGANAKEDALKIATKEAVECHKKLKSMNSDQKIECLVKITEYLSIYSARIEGKLLDLQLSTTGY